MLVIYCWAWDLPLFMCGLYAQWALIGENWFSFGSGGHWLGWESVHIPPLRAGPRQSWVCAGLVCAATVWVNMCVSPVCHPSPWLLAILLPSHTHDPWGVELDEDSSFRTECSKVSHYLHIVHCPVVCISSYPLQASLMITERDNVVRIILLHIALAEQ